MPACGPSQVFVMALSRRSAADGQHLFFDGAHASASVVVVEAALQFAVRSQSYAKPLA
jgi:hypothetical protein